MDEDARETRPAVAQNARGRSPAVGADHDDDNSRMIFITFVVRNLKK